MKKLKPIILICLLLTGILLVCKSQSLNKLSQEERKAGWKLLFNGKNFNGWHTYLKQNVDPCWKIEDGAIVLDHAGGKGSGDIVTNEEFENYELRLEWKISPAGNSGIIFNIHEDPKYQETYFTGSEMQVLDNAKASDNKIASHLAGSLYDLIACDPDAVNPAGEWNRVKIRVDEGHLTFWMNGEKVVETQMWNEDWKKMIANSVYAQWRENSTYHKGHIALQDHGHKVWYRNIKIRKLDSKNISLAPEIDSSLQFIILNAVKPTPEAFKEIRSVFGRQAGKTKIGIGFIISYLSMAPDRAATKLRKYLSLSEQFDMPVVVQLDGEQWWGNRPDLWNWWDKSKPGYDPKNKRNVEWTGWTPDSAVKIGWRNWGRQIRVLPMPNLMSPAYRKACHTEMKKLVPIVMDWWHALPEEKKYLLVGIKTGWESAIGVNNWYYPNGNELINQSAEKDPTYGLKVDSLPDRGVETIGYAAVSTLGLADSGKLTEEQLTKVVKLHLKDLCKVCANLGVLRNKLFTHCGGWSKGETLYTAAVNQYSCPGWSFYKYAYNPEKDSTAMAALRSSNAPYWGAVEWLYQGKDTKQGWMNALENTLSVPRLKYLCIYNWSGIKNNQAAIRAIRTLSAVIETHS